MKNKKMLLILLIIILIVTLIIFVLTYNKPFKLNDNKIIGIIDAYKHNDIVDNYVDMDKIKRIEIGGYEEYIIIPRNNKVKINIYELIMNEEGNFDRKYIDKTNKPFYLKCNMSDLFSNVLIEVSYQNKIYEYSPYISLKDGSLVLKDFVLNIEK